jgi:DNA-directed RNA polymerase subunit M/transcription elongation factor TFIIS
MIRYTCPSCKTLLVSPDHKVGTKVACPTCDERLRVPMPDGETASSSRGRKEADHYPMLREVEEEEEPKPRRSGRRRKRRFRCHRCHSTDPPIEKTEISQTGWILFIVLLLVFWPLCFIGLLQKETYLACGDCGARVR